MLIGNGYRLSQNPGRLLGGNAAGSINRSNWGEPGALKNIWVGDAAVDNKSGYPAGYRHPGSWSMAPKSGGMSSRYEAFVEFTTPPANAAQGLNIAGASSISFLTVGAAAAIAAAIGSATITFSAAANATAPLNAVGTAQITFTATAGASAIGEMVGTTTITFIGEADLSAIGHMVAEPIDQTLTPEAIAAAVWNALSVSYNSTGTMGEKVNDAGSASNPWTEIIESGLTAEQILRLLLSVATGQTTIETVGNQTFVKFKSVDGTIDRVAATIENKERVNIDLETD